MTEPRFRPPRGRCDESCPAWALCSSLLRHDPDVPVVCEWDDEAVGIDPTTQPDNVRWDVDLVERNPFDPFEW